MEIWLKENENNSFRLPVLPSEYTMTSGNTINTMSVNEVGEIALFSGNKLYSMTLTSFFPRQAYNFCEYKNIITPESSIDKIEKWRKSGAIIRLIITGTKINIPVIIEHFRYGERDGTRDVYYEIILREYRYLKTTVSNEILSIKKPTRPIPPPQPTQRTHTVVSGDTLWDIAAKYYGSGAKYPTIVSANQDKIKNPNLIYPGQVFVIP